MSDRGTVTESGAIRFVRMLPGPVERVWQFLTDPEKRGLWLAGGPMELWVGGRVTLRFRHADLSPHPAATPDDYRHVEDGATLTGRITRCEPPRVLSYTWGEGGEPPSEVTFELAEVDGRVRLVVTHRRLDGPAMPEVASGWHAHLAILADRLEGRIPAAFWEVFLPLLEDYRRRIPSKTLPH